MKFRLTEEQIQYNANPRDKNEGDCTVRALSLAYDMPYNSVKSELSSLGSKEHVKFNMTPAIEDFINKHGFKNVYDNETDNINIDDVDDFAKKYKRGTYVIFCSNSPKQANSYHLVTIIDGKIYDTWDSSNYYVLKAWEVNRHSNRNYKFNLKEYEPFIIQTLQSIGVESADFIYHRLGMSINMEVLDRRRRINIRLNKNDIEKSREEIEEIIKSQIERQLNSKLHESFYIIEAEDKEVLGRDLFSNLNNMFDKSQFKDDFFIYYDSIPKRSEIMEKFKDYPNFAQTIIDMFDENIDAYEASNDTDKETIVFTDLITGVEDYCNQYAQEYLSGNTEF